MEFKNNQINFDEKTLLTFVTETKNGEHGKIEITASELFRIEVLRDEPPEPIYYYSFK